MPMRSSRLISKLALVILIALSGIVAAVSMTDTDGSRASIAGTGPKVVEGYVYDLSGIPLEGAVVTVEVIDQSTHLPKATQSDTTGPEGYYMVTFGDQSLWNVGDTLKATAIYDSNSQSNETLADDSGFQSMDVNFGFIIPEFGSLFGSVVAVAGMVCFIAMRVRRRY